MSGPHAISRRRTPFTLHLAGFALGSALVLVALFVLTVLNWLVAR